jgi:parallel beta-helix repeat protein
VANGRWAKYVALLVMIALAFPAGVVLVAGNPLDDEPAEDTARTPPQCTSARAQLAAGLERYVAQFAGVDVFGPAGTPLPDLVDLRRQATHIMQNVGGMGCNPAEFSRRALRDLERLTGDGPLGEAVAGAVAANVRDVFRPGDDHRVELDSGDDLAAAIARLPLDATLVLPSGRVGIDRPVVVLQDIRIVGSGPAHSRIESTAGQGALVLMGPAHLRLERLSLAHIGESPASLVVARAGQVSVANVVLTGAKAAAGGGGSPSDLALQGGGSAVVAAGAEAVSVRHSRLTGNDSAGLVAAGDVEVHVRGGTVTGGRSCGLCFLSRSHGTVRDVRISGSGVGVVVGERSRPVVTGATISGNERGGVLVEGRAGPVIRDSSVSGNGRLGIAVYGVGAPRVQGNRISGHTEAGVVVDTRRGGRPVIRDNVFTRSGQAALAFVGESRGAARGNTCLGDRLQLVLDGSARPTLADNDCAVHDQRR